MISPSSVPSGLLSPWPLFLFFSVASLEDMHMGVGVGGWGTIGMAGEAPPVWVVSNTRRSGVFSSNTIPSGILTPFWLVLAWAGHRGRRKLPRASSWSSYW